MSQIFVGSLPQNTARVAVIMAGGSGTRFWPLSRSSRPKQFLPLAGGAKSLLQATAGRVEALCSEDSVLVVTAEHQSALVREQLPQASVLCEPCARNTAACIGFAAIKVLHAVGDVPMLCLPSDHVVHGVDEIVSVYQDACALALEQEVLLTIGIRPTGPETGYGYIQRSEETVAMQSGSPAWKVNRFVEKPDRQTAEQYLLSGEYFWNSGMFVWRPSVVLAAIEQFLPELSNVLDKISAAFDGPNEYDEIAKLYRSIDPVSIDVGIMERAQNVLMLPGEAFTWSDVGSWSSWSEARAEESADGDGNIAEGDAIFVGTRNTTLVGQRRLIAAVGTEDLIVVDTPDALLVCHRDKAQDVRVVVEELKKNSRSDLL